MSCREFSEWKIRNDIQPFGERRQHLQIALLASCLLNAIRASAGNSQRSKPTDFIIDPLIPPEVQSEASMKMLCKALADSAKKGKRGK